MELKDKVVLKEKQAVPVSMGDLVATLRWTKPVDLDLWCFYKLKDGLTGDISYSRRGTLNGEPFIKLDKDSGVGGTGGDNEENIRFKSLENIEHAFICANIYGQSGANFASYDGSVIVKSSDTQIEVPLSSKKLGSWCVIAHFDNRILPKLENLNITISKKPKLNDLLGGNVQESDAKKTGFFGSLFGG